MELEKYEYYRTDLGVLYHGDCLEIMPHLEPVDLVLTDPPYPKLKYGVDWNKYPHGCSDRYRESKSMGTPWGNDVSGSRMASKISKHGSLIFCSFHSVDIFSTIIDGKRAALCSWYQSNSPPSQNNAPHFQVEYVWAYRKNPGLNWRELKTFYDVKRLQAGCMATERLVDGGGKALHPTQKPLSLIMDLLKIGGDLILDPFLGSGTTAVACERLNRRWIGIEIEEKYCEIAKKRIEKERRQMRLF